MNSAYFHRIAASRQVINHMHYLVDTGGNKIQSQENIQLHCVEFFTKLLGGYEPPTQFHPSDLSSLLEFRCSNSQREVLNKDFSDADIKAAVFSLPRNKTPGLDGYSVEFSKSCWSVVGPEVIEAMREFFRTGNY